jgi:hypothetical protein
MRSEVMNTRPCVRNMWTGAKKQERGTMCQGTKCQVSGKTGLTGHSDREREWQATVLGNESGRPQC